MAVVVKVKSFTGASPSLNVTISSLEPVAESKKIMNRDSISMSVGDFLISGVKVRQIDISQSMTNH